MKPIEDERIRFFLKHRQQLEEWQAVKKDLSKFAHEFYESLRDDVLDAVPDDVVVGEMSEPPGNSGLFQLRRFDWPEEGPAVELGWWRKDRMEFSIKDYLWCGLHADRSSPYWQSLCDARGRPETIGYPEWKPSEPQYPMYRYLPHPEGNIWEDNQLQSHGQSVIEAVLQAWADLAPIVDINDVMTIDEAAAGSNSFAASARPRLGRKPPRQAS